MLLCLTACLLLGPAQPPTKKNLGGVELVELPMRVQGYRTLQIAGFTVLADPKVVEPPEKLEKTPLEVLEAELKTIGRIVHAKALAELRKLTIWAEWDEEQGLGNGRQGKALAVYYGGSQRSMLAAGKNPLKANNITVLSTRDLAREHQPKRDSGRCVLLHEMVHAVHHKILGFENPKIEAAYRQALASGKLERGSYAATNAAEFFAEMSCAYLDKLGYYPRDKEELKKHDPSTFQLMSVIWSGAESGSNRARKSPMADAMDLPVLDMTLADFQAGEVVSGPAVPEPSELQGRVVLILFFAAQSPDALLALGKAALLDADCAEVGLTVLASHASRGAQESDIRKAAQIRAPKLSVSLIPRLARNPGLGKLPHALVFDSEGALRFSGSPYDAELAARKLVGRLLLEKVTGLDDGENPPQILAPSVDALRKGEKPPTVLLRLEKLTPVEKPVLELRDTLVLSIAAGPKAQVAELRARQDKEPALVFCEMEQMAQRWKGSSIGALLAPLLSSLRKAPAVQQELRARILLERMRLIDGQLAKRPGAIEPASLGFRSANADLLNSLSQVLEKLRVEFKGAPSLAEAERLMAKYRID